MALTLKDLAKLANVAESTVSRALNNKAGVSAEKRKEIIKLADKYNYKPNRLAKGLAEQKTKTIALLLPDLEYDSSFQVINAVEEELEKQDYQMLICNTRKSLSKSEKYLMMLAEDRVDGVILLGEIPTGGALIKLGLDKGNKIVLIDKLLEEMILTSHLINHNKSGLIAAEGLLNKKSIKDSVIMIGEENDYIEQERVKGFTSKCKEYGLKPKIITGLKTREDGYESFFEIIDKISLPAGIFITSNIAGIGLMEAIKTGGWLIPDDFQIIGCGQDKISKVSNPKLTVIKEPLTEMAKEAVLSLINGIESEVSPGKVKIYNPDIVENNSTR
ncbi:MAG: LacI family DNA-binding transcriptional regulator [Bacillota bacterium]